MPNNWDFFFLLQHETFDAWFGCERQWISLCHRHSLLASASRYYILFRFFFLFVWKRTFFIVSPTQYFSCFIISLDTKNTSLSYWKIIYMILYNIFFFLVAVNLCVICDPNFHIILNDYQQRAMRIFTCIFRLDISKYFFDTKYVTLNYYVAFHNFSYSKKGSVLELRHGAFQFSCI